MVVDVLYIIEGEKSWISLWCAVRSVILARNPTEWLGHPLLGIFAAFESSNIKLLGGQIINFTVYLIKIKLQQGV